MRLIDADKLIEILEENISKLARDIKLEQRGMQLSIFVAQLCQTKHIIGVIDKQPTAYDVDKVVEQLKALCNAEVDYYSSNDVIDREDALDIVKKGGLDES